MNDFAGRSSWRINFALMTVEQQRAKVVELARRGWSRGSISGLTGWPEARVNEVIRSQQQEPRQ